MSNRVPLAGGTLPDPNKLATGQALRSDEVIYIPEMLNHSINSARCQPVVGQVWSDRICRYEVAGAAYTDVATWRIPVLTDTHVLLEIRIYADAAAGAGSGSVRFTSAGSGLTFTFPVAALSIYATLPFAGLISAPVGATDYDDITMSISADTGQEVAVHSVTIRYEELVLAGAGLPVQIIGGAEPFGVDVASDPDYPLPAAQGQRFITALSALRDRPRQMFCWSGLSAAVVTYTGSTTGGVASETMGGYPHWLSSVINPGENSDNSPDLTVWVKTRADAVSATVAKLSQWVVEVPAASGDTWRQPSSGQAAVRLEKSVFRTTRPIYRGEGAAEAPEFTMPQDAWGSLVMGAETTYNTSASTAGILAASVWGP